VRRLLEDHRDLAHSTFEALVGVQVEGDVGLLVCVDFELDCGVGFGGGAFVDVFFL